MAAERERTRGPGRGARLAAARPAAQVLGASSTADFNARLTVLSGRRPAGPMWQDLGHAKASRPGSATMTTAQLWVQLPAGSAAREALLPTLGSRIRQRHRPWANPMWATAFVTGFVVYFILCTMLLVQVRVPRVHGDAASCLHFR